MAESEISKARKIIKDLEDEACTHRKNLISARDTIDKMKRDDEANLSNIEELDKQLQKSKTFYKELENGYNSEKKANRKTIANLNKTIEGLETSHRFEIGSKNSIIDSLVDAKKMTVSRLNIMQQLVNDAITEREY